MAGRTAWFPGHMAKGTRQLEELLDKLDVIVEVRDARAPELTASPLTKKFARRRPVWIVMTKRDLADKDITAQWLGHYKNNRREAWAFDLLSRQIAPLKQAFTRCKPKYRELRVAVVGIPNVGKSALLNLLIGKKSAPVGGIPGITRGVSWYRGGDFLVVDSPGILDPRSGAAVQRALAWLGCSKADVIGGYDTVACSLIDYLQRQGLWHFIEEKWGVPADPEDTAAVLEAVGRRLGCLVSGGMVDYTLAGRRFLESFSTGKLGNLSLESPTMPAAERLQAPEDGDEDE
ncbi:GTPase [Pyramidobacter sp. YE332]|uniref:YlqF/YawG family GTPase n=1 Tax=unclassified Pyramidobacter TaxID=2632171 RepID=UPI00098FE541|nr:MULTISPECIES: GTPase [unclassified Pyramidobacter]OON87760.1 ribosome biogenesis GTP-binding protein [Pyramidobacter sp. C12-8]WOL41154.1 GTPase [Pyramidobacter sp. YE332]